MANVIKNVAGSENVGGSAVPLFMPNDSGGGTLIGRLVVFSEKLKPAGSVGDAALICYDQFAVGMRREINLRRSLEAGFLNDSIWWRLTVRCDGQSTWSSTLTEQNGQKVSPFVCLAARGGSSSTMLGDAGMITTKAIEEPSAPAVVKPHQERRH